jgi:transcriptional regulator with XRE-family HTH domain
VRDVRHDLARLGRRVRQRRYELGLTQRDAAVAGRVSDQTWVNVERGTKVSDRTLASVERSLRWQPGSAQAVAEGGEPVETGGSDRSLQERVAALEAELIALRDELATRQRT